MGSVIFFLIAFLVALLGMMLWNVKSESISAIKSMILCCITELCIAAIVAGIYKLFNTSVNLISIGIGYLIFGILLWISVLKKGKVQKLKFLKDEIYAMLIIVGFFFVIFLKTFTLDLSNVYRNSDPGVHLLMALNVLNTGETSSMFFAEVYNALVMAIFQPFLSGINLYKAFILADSFANILNVSMFYVVASSFCKSRFSKIILPFMCGIYFLGWPFFNYIIGGFVHFGWGITLFLYVVYWLKVLYESEEKKIQNLSLVLIVVGCFSVLVCYLLLVPILGLVVVLCLLINAKKRNISLPKPYRLPVVIGTICILTIAFCVCFFGYFEGDWSKVFSALQKDGGIQKDFYRDFIFLLPAAIYMLCQYVKNKQKSIIILTLTVILGYTLIMFIFCWNGVISPYYYYKNYYLLWVFLWIINIEAMECLYNKDKTIVASYGITMTFAIWMTISGIDERMAEERIVIDEVSYRHYPSLFPILDRMEIFINEENDIKDKDALIDTCNYINEVLNEENSEITLITNVYYLDTWYRCYSRNNTILVYSDDEFAEAIEKCAESGNQYFLVHQNTEIYRRNNNILDEYKSLYNNGYYGIYQVSD